LINDKKQLTGGGCGFKVGGMTISSAMIFLVACFAIYFGFTRLLTRRRVGQTGAARLGRIKKASWFIVVLMSVCLVLGFYEFLAFLFGWPHTLPFERIVIGHEHFYRTADEMPGAVRSLWIVQQLLTFWCGVMWLRLFWLYGRGILFTAKNVTCIRFVGWWLMINWFVELEMQSALRDANLSTNSLFIGLLVIFIAWIMDEGRKIQEEQELTV
jgi:hypothetical protein